MNARDYATIAAAFANAKPDSCAGLSVQDGFEEAREAIAISIADAFRDDSSFDREQFLTACGLSP